MITGAPFDAAPDTPLWKDIKGKIGKLQEGGKITPTEAEALLADARAALLTVRPAYERVIAWAQAEPTRATQLALKRAGLGIDEIDLYEVNEAFASVPLAWLQALHADPLKLNVNGGAIALGHPLGSSGTKLLSTLVHALRARGKRYGLQTMCEGGGVANVTIYESL